jgi:hypothetical protein
MKLTERLNVLIQAVTLSQKNGGLTLDEAYNAKIAIDVISSGILNQDFSSAVNVLIKTASESQKKGVYTLKDAYMIYNAIENIDVEFQNEVNMINAGVARMENEQDTNKKSVAKSPTTPKKK